MSDKQQKIFRIIIKVIALALLLFFFLPWVFVNCTGVYISGYDFAVGRRAVDGDPYPIVFGLVLVPVILITLAFAKKSFKYIRNVAILGLVCLLAFMFLFLNTIENRGLGAYVEFTIYMSGMVLMYFFLIGIGHYGYFIIRRDKKPDDDSNTMLDYSIYKIGKRPALIWYGIMAVLFLVGALVFGILFPIETDVEVYGRGFLSSLTDGSGIEFLRDRIWWVIGLVVMVAVVVLLQIRLKGRYNTEIMRQKYRPETLIHSIRVKYEFWVRLGTVFAFIAVVPAVFMLSAIDSFVAIGVTMMTLGAQKGIKLHVVGSAFFTLLSAAWYTLMLMTGVAALDGIGFLDFVMSAVTILLRGGGIGINTLMTILAVLGGASGLIFIVIAGIFLTAGKAALRNAPNIVKPGQGPPPIVVLPDVKPQPEAREIAVRAIANLQLEPPAENLE
ncbi:MAG: hypothetical protein FWC73_12030 [Defluviitaleaceae bacterium]|nr:hypothetical protein [Defluviitaleaceae bacterium]